LGFFCLNLGQCRV